MLQLLHIENIAVIERADIELEGGLTVLSGETGAGKSKIIDSIGAILGRRVSRDLVRSGAKKGFVSAVFTELPPALCQLVNELDLAGDEGDTLHIQRQLTADGKSSCRVNMKPVSASTLRLLAPYLIDIHGQNDGQKLLDEAHHIDYLDGYAGNAALLERYRPNYQALLALRREIHALETGEQERLQRIDMLSFHKDEIEQAALKPDEDETLAQRKAYFDHAGKIAGALERARLALSGDDEVGGACAMLDEVSAAISALREVSDAFDGMAEQAEEAAQLHAAPAEAVPGGAVAVPDAQIIGRSPLYVRQVGPAHQELLHLLPVHGREVLLRDLELLLQEVVGVIPVVEEAEHHLEVRPGVEGQEVQLPEQRQGPVPGTAEQVDQIHIHVVIHPERGIPGAQAQGHRAAAAADLQQAGRPPGEQLENIGEQEQLPAYPGEEGFSDPPHLPRVDGRPPWPSPSYGWPSPRRPAFAGDARLWQSPPRRWRGRSSRCGRCR